MGKKIDLTGQRFGRLVVVCDTTARAQNGEVVWLCLCDCGGYSSIPMTSLRLGRTKSCGCLSVDALTGNRRRRKNITGKRFGRLLVVRRVGTCRGHSVWQCLCDCGETTFVRYGNLTHGCVKSCGCMAIEAIANRHLCMHSNLTPKNIPIELVNVQVERIKINRELRRKNEQR